MSTLNTYIVGLTIRTNMQIEAYSEAEALEIAWRDWRSEDLEGAVLNQMVIEETLEDEPGRLERYAKAAAAYHEVADEFGPDSQQAKDAWAIVSSLI